MPFLNQGSIYLFVCLLQLYFILLFHDIVYLIYFVEIQLVTLGISSLFVRFVVTCYLAVFSSNWSILLLVSLFVC